jgi:D-glycero-beta-D-manno-heptose-7-phosphate kinase
MVKLASMLSRLNRAKILVVGDLLLDLYTVGQVRRISPEAPVVIVNVNYEDKRPGGAGNVILNLLSLGAEVAILGRVGSDWAGEFLKDELANEGVDTKTIVFQKAYRTPMKNRVIADHQQIVRIDHEEVTLLSSELEQSLIHHLPDLLAKADVIAISDYGKGFLTPSLLATLMQQAKQLNIPVITDPKGQDFSKYRGTTVIKPNVSEAYAVANLPSHASLDLVAERVLNQTDAQLLMITRGAEGISIFDAAGARSDFPVQAKKVSDVTGAGDTVLAMLAYAVANQLSYEETAQLCNAAAGIAIEHVGCVRVTLSDLAYRLFESSLNCKIFDQEHLFVLQQILKNKPFHLLILSPMNQLTVGFFQSIQSLARDSHAVLAYVKEDSQSTAFIELLASLREIGFIVTQVDRLTTLCQFLNPQTIYRFDPAQDKLIPLNPPMPLFAEELEEAILCL